MYNIYIIYIIYIHIFFNLQIAKYGMCPIMIYYHCDDYNFILKNKTTINTVQQKEADTNLFKIYTLI